MSADIDYQNLPKGYIIDQRYEIKKRLGSGGFGAVYMAYDLQLKINKALKIISSEFSKDKEAMFDLEKEARVLINLNHPNIVRIYDIHLTGETKYLDMEYVEGGDLVDLKLQYDDKKVPEEMVLNIASQISEALNEAHKKGVIHKDIKPANIMMTKEGNVKLMDFGIAEMLRSTVSSLKKSKIEGTPLYMSPEQLVMGEVNEQTDIWSFGVTIHELLTGKCMFAGSSLAQILIQIEKKKFEPIEYVSDKTNQLIDKCIKYKPEERFKNFGEVLDFMDELNEEEKKKEQELLKEQVKLIQEEIQKNKDEKTREKFKDKMDSLLSDDSIKDWITFKIKLSKFMDEELDLRQAEKENMFNEAKQIFGEQNPGKTTQYIESSGSFKSNKKKKKQVYEEAGKKRSFPFISVLILLLIASGSVYIYLNQESFFKKEAVPKPDMVYIQGGEFLMGNIEFSPIRRVKLDDYYVSRSEVTFHQYDSFCRDTGREFPDDRGWGRGARPVIYVSWYDAVEYCNWLSRKEGLEPCYIIDKENKDIQNLSKNDNLRWRVQWMRDVKGYRLPTEAEWEYAARGGVKEDTLISNKKDEKWAGGLNIDELAWYEDNSGGKTHPVMLKKPNELNLYDMSGNVDEWCFDWYHEDYYKADNNMLNPLGSVNGRVRVFRGGNFKLSRRFETVTHRNGCQPDGKLMTLGFRIARTD